MYRGYGVAGQRHNIEVFYTIPGHGYEFRLYTCMECGEVYVVDMGNPELAKITIPEGLSIQCKSCGADLSASLFPYPQNFVTENGDIGSFEPSKIIPPDSESYVRDIWEIP